MEVYEQSIGDFPARSWAKTRLVLRGSDCSNGLISGAGCARIGLGL